MEQERGQTKVEEDKRRRSKNGGKRKDVEGWLASQQEREVKCKRVLERGRGFWKKRGDEGDGENIRG